MNVEKLSQFLDDFFANCGDHFYSEELADLLIDFFQEEMTKDELNEFGKKRFRICCQYRKKDGYEQ
jgi:hypothetical protein